MVSLLPKPPSRLKSKAKAKPSKVLVGRVLIANNPRSHHRFGELLISIIPEGGTKNKQRAVVEDIAFLSSGSAQPPQPAPRRNRKPCQGAESCRPSASRRLECPVKNGSSSGSTRSLRQVLPGLFVGLGGAPRKNKTTRGGRGGGVYRTYLPQKAGNWNGLPKPPHFYDVRFHVN